MSDIILIEWEDAVDIPGWFDADDLPALISNRCIVQHIGFIAYIDDKYIVIAGSINKYCSALSGITKIPVTWLRKLEKVGEVQTDGFQFLDIKQARTELEQYIDKE